MRSRQLGASDLQVSEISLGCSLTAGSGDGAARACGISVAQLALARMLREENVASAVVDASRTEQVHQTPSDSGSELDTETRAKIDAILA
jgi:aryl-alcohol dehydrogenase-like predicted oxidoreductase